MKLLFDENLSPKLCYSVAAHFPGSAHLRECGLLGASDELVWEYARAHGFIIVSKDSDFQERSILCGHPPKIVWLRVGNCTVKQLFEHITAHQSTINAFCADPRESVLIVP